MSSTMSSIAIAVIAAIGLIGVTGFANAQESASGAPVLNAEPKSMQDGPHPDEPEPQSLKICPDVWLQDGPHPDEPEVTKLRMCLDGWRPASTRH